MTDSYPKLDPHDHAFPMARGNPRGQKKHEKKEMSFSWAESNIQLIHALLSLSIPESSPI